MFTVSGTNSHDPYDVVSSRVCRNDTPELPVISYRVVIADTDNVSMLQILSWDVPFFLLTWARIAPLAVVAWSDVVADDLPRSRNPIHLANLV